jgi:hypothetical protein
MLPGFISKYLEQLLDSILKPGFEAIKGWNWGARVVLFLSLLGITFAIWDWKAVLQASRNAAGAVRVMRSTGKRIPLPAAAVDSLDRAIRKLSASSEAELASLSNDGSEPWPIAQLLLALDSLRPVDTAAMATFFRNTSVAKCGCWREFHKSNLPPNIPGTGWILSALTSLHVPADSVATFLRRQQQPDGWWSLFPVADNPSYASTYGTSLAIMGLRSQLLSGRLSTADSLLTETTLQRGVAWLLRHREKSSPRWRSYPITDRGRASESLSGLATHTILILSPDASGDLAEAWMASLPETIPPADAADPPSLYDITSTYGVSNDHFVQISLPWLIIATVDAYPHVGVRGQIRGLMWLTKAMESGQLGTSDTSPESWWRAEVLVSLRYLKAAI